MSNDRLDENQNRVTGWRYWLGVFWDDPRVPLVAVMVAALQQPVFLFVLGRCPLWLVIGMQICYGTVFWRLWKILSLHVITECADQSDRSIAKSDTEKT